MGLADEKWHHNVTSVIGLAHTQNDPMLQYGVPRPQWRKHAVSHSLI